jgi:hypothetical protein
MRKEECNGLAWGEEGRRGRGKALAWLRIGGVGGGGGGGGPRVGVKSRDRYMDGAWWARRCPAIDTFLIK